MYRYIERKIHKSIYTCAHVCMLVRVRVRARACVCKDQTLKAALLAWIPHTILAIALPGHSPDGFGRNTIHIHLVVDAQRHVQIFKHFLSTAKRRKTQTVGNPSVDGCPSAQGTMEALEAFETCYGMASPVCCYNGRGSDDGYSTCWWWLFLFLQKVV